MSLHSVFPPEGVLSFTYPGNLILNGSFASGDSTGWTFTGASVSQTLTHGTNEYSAKLPGGSSATILQALNGLPVDNILALHYYASTTGANAGSMGVLYTFSDAANLSVGSNYYAGISPIWDLNDLLAILQSGRAHKHLTSLTISTGEPYEDEYVDDVVLTMNVAYGQSILIYPPQI